MLLCAQISFKAGAQEWRRFDGKGNNLKHIDWGKANGVFRNYMTNAFSDKMQEPNGNDRKNPREISNEIASQKNFMANEKGLSDFVWGWGQFIDHDINLNDDSRSEPMDIAVPKCDPNFDPDCSGTAKIHMFRSLSDPATGASFNNPRKHINEITSFIDGSAVYGSSASRADWLRSKKGGKLKVSAGNLLPWNTSNGEYEGTVDIDAPSMVIEGKPNLKKFFIAGDVRANEQPTLTSFHTLWVREHNRICEILVQENPDWTDEQIFQKARKMVGALIQTITYNEFLPAIGVNCDLYKGYDEEVNPNILNTFSAAAYRFGHTMVNGRLMRIDEVGDEWTFGAMDLRHGFFNPTILKDEGGIAPFFRGMAAQQHQMVDPMIMDDIRNFLFGNPGAGGMDLLSINLQRARERGLPDYNTIREEIGLTKHENFASLTSNVDLQKKLEVAYKNINQVDPWIGFMSEDHLPDAIMGEGLHTILKMQFEFLRNGDRFYYENDKSFSKEELDEIRKTTLSKVITRNSKIENLQANVFKAYDRTLLQVELFPFPEISNLSLKAYPNPVQKYFTITMQSRRPMHAQLMIFDSRGMLKQQKSVALKQGENSIAFELSDAIAEGIYTIQMKTETSTGSLKIIKTD